eukprot:CAMPEP_0113459766 /NCGR_PEP_ID=MMETSP0014_2-20120614/10631_1 /TAXON_ID=2857 /ORGANISM="Nitzschia sp." /LENGTH=470 /DNA_ID=CAMNT_0000351379 /DNA_START=217 /DNA_END=1629 /DNA_ORIENTATION=- /assembly_acc=CAM_ASM_000159
MARMPVSSLSSSAPIPNASTTKPTAASYPRDFRNASSLVVDLFHGQHFTTIHNSDRNDNAGDSKRSIISVNRLPSRPNRRSYHNHQYNGGGLLKAGNLMMASHLAGHGSSRLTSPRRFMSSSSSSPDDETSVLGVDAASGQQPNFEETMDQLFQQGQQVAPTSEADQWLIDQAVAAEPWDPKWWNCADHAINVINFCHDTTGLTYAGSIMATTCLIRMIIFPLAIKGQRSSSRMAHLQPELEQMKKRYEALGTPSQAEQKAFGQNMQALFKRYEVNPFASLGAAIVQIPAFMGMFFGLKKMPELFPDQLSTGGILWFTDLTAPDPTFILPIICGVTFFATIELGKDQMLDSNPQQGQMFVMAFRAMAVVMVPAIMYFPSSVLCYWVPNNFLTMVQSVVLRNETVKKQFGIWDRPKAIPGSSPGAGFQETMTKLVKQVKGEPTSEKEVIKRHNEDVAVKKRVQNMNKRNAR